METKPIFVKAVKEQGDCPALFMKLEDSQKVSDSKTLQHMLDSVLINKEN